MILLVIGFVLGMLIAGLGRLVYREISGYRKTKSALDAELHKFD